MQRNPIYSIVALIVAFFGLSGLYVLLEAPFVAVVQIIVYAGAILVLFLFVGDAAERVARRRRRVGSLASATTGRARRGSARCSRWCCIGAAGVGAYRARRASARRSARRRPASPTCGVLGRVLFTDYMFAFEVTSILIIAAMVGAVRAGAAARRGE